MNHSNPNHHRSKTTVTATLLALSICIGILLYLNARHSAAMSDTAGTDKAKGAAGTHQSSTADTLLKKAERAKSSKDPSMPLGAPIGLAEIPSDQQDRDVAAAMQRALEDVRAGLGTPGAPLKPITVKNIDPSLLPKSAVPTAEQIAALGKLHWQSGKQLEYRLDGNGSVSFLEGMRIQPAAGAAEPGFSLEATTARQFIKDKTKLLQLKDPEAETTLASESKDELGYTQVRFRQKFNGLEVYPADLLVQLNPKGDVSLVMGSYTPTPSGLSTTPTIDAGHAVTVAQDYVKSDASAEILDKSLVVYAPKKRSPKLAYKVEVNASMIHDWMVFVDARDGSVINSYDRVCSAAATGSGVDELGQTRSLKLWKSTDNKYYLCDTSKPMFNAAGSKPPAPDTTKGGIIISDGNNVTDRELNRFYYCNSTNNNSGWRKDAVGAAFNLGRIYDYYKTRFKRNSIDGNGGTISGIVNVTMDNAFWNDSAKCMVFGNLDRYPSALDVVAHEMTHGVTFKTSNLEYQDQSGALNESMSDIFGEGCEGYYNANKLPDYLLGTLLKQGIGRDMIKPENKNCPSRMSNYVTTTQDSGGVHTNSSIINHAFWLLAQGLNPGIGQEHALDIFYRTNTTKLQKNSQFLDCRRACVASAKELYGSNSTEAQKTAAAFDAVEIFDGKSNPPPPPTGGTSGTDSTLATVYNNFVLYLGRRETAQGDGVYGNFLGNNPAAPYKRLSVWGNGTIAVFVTADYDLGFVDTLTGKTTLLGFAGKVYSVATSASGTKYGLVFRNQTTGDALNTIWVYDDDTKVHKTYALIAPTIDGGGSDTVQYADSLDFSVEGRYLYYDALNQLMLPNGRKSTSWSIFAIDRENGQTHSVFQPKDGLDIGNPAIGQSHTNLMTFEISDVDGVGNVLAFDLASGNLSPGISIANGIGVPGVSYPGYNGADNALIYTNYYFDTFGYPTAYLEKQPLAADGITPSGDATVWMGTLGLESGVIYRRGTFQGLPTLSVKATDAVAQKGINDTGKFSISRIGSRAKAMPFTFVLTGTAVNGTDYVSIPLSASIPAGSTQVTITITPRNQNLGKGNRNVKMTLTSTTYFTLDNASAAVNIKDAP